MHQDSSWGILGLSQKSYIERVLAKFDMKDCHSRDTPIIKEDKFSLINFPENEVEKKGIQKIHIVRSLMYDQVWMLGILK